MRPPSLPPCFENPRPLCHHLRRHLCPLDYFSRPVFLPLLTFSLPRCLWRPAPRLHGPCLHGPRLRRCGKKGYYAARLYKLFGGKEWKKNTVLTATLFPTSVFVIFMVLDTLLYYEGASTAVPFSTLMALILLWFGISLPLVLVGSYFGFKKEAFEVPVRTNQIARHVPEQMWYTHPAFAIALGGVLPFGAVCIELFFIMSALWLHQVAPSGLPHPRGPLETSARAFCRHRRPV